MLRARSLSVSTMMFFHYSRERRTEIKAKLPDFRRFAVIGLAEERNVVLG